MPNQSPANETGRKRRKSPLWAKLLLGFGIVLVVASGSTVTFVQVAESKVDAAIPNHELAGGSGNTVKHADIKGAKNILLASLDTRPSWSKTGEASHTDSIIILHVSADHSQAYMVSIPRDTMVQIPKYDNGKYKTSAQHNKINAAFAFGSMQLDGDQAIENGMTLLVNTIKLNYGITPDAMGVVNYDGFKDILAQIKQVCLYVDENVTSIHIGHTADGKQAVPYTTNSAGLDLKKVWGVTPNQYKIGNRCLDPVEALDFARQRDILKPLNDGDYGRQRHQQQLLKAILKTAVKQGLNSPAKLPGILTAIGKAMTFFQQGISLEDWAFGLKGINPDNIVTLKTNAGGYHSEKIGGVDYETLDADSLEMIKATKNDTLGEFVQTHPTFVVKS